MEQNGQSSPVCPLTHPTINLSSYSSNKLREHIDPIRPTNGGLMDDKRPFVGMDVTAHIVSSRLQVQICGSGTFAFVHASTF